MARKRVECLSCGEQMWSDVLRCEGCGGSRTGSLDEAVKIITKCVGADVIMNFNDYGSDLEVIPTGCMALDNALWVGGFPRGMISTLYGPDSGGKTSFCYNFIANLTRLGLKAVFIDMEKKGSSLYMRRIFESHGVDLDDILVIRPRTGEDVWQIINSLVGEVDAIVVDSIAAMPTRAELDAKAGDKHVGILARLLGTELKRTIGDLGKSRTVLLLTNQVRDRIGGYGDTEGRPGGHALSHQEVIRVRLTRFGGPITEKGAKKIGIQVRATVRKNQAGAPFGIAEFDLLFGIGKDGRIGLDRFKDVAEAGVALGVFGETTSGRYQFTVPGEEEAWKCHGKDKIMPKLKDSPEFMAAVEDAVHEAIRVKWGVKNVEE